MSEPRPTSPLSLLRRIGQFGCVFALAAGTVLLASAPLRDPAPPRRPALAPDCVALGLEPAPEWAGAGAASRALARRPGGCTGPRLLA